jgi:hypothetical protein
VQFGDELPERRKAARIGMKKTRCSSGIRSTSGLAVVTVALALGGCGSDDETATTATTTVTAQATGPTGATGSASASTAAGTSRSDAVAVVERYYRLIEQEQYAEAWLLVPAVVRAESGGFQNWRAGYAANVRSDPTNLRVASFSGDSATLSLDLDSTDIDACTGERVGQTFSGSWTLEVVDGSWKPESISMEKISGGTPTLTSSDCGGSAGGGGGPAPTSNCDPGYSGCVPPYPPDVDCAQVGGPVTVTGLDPHGLDADNDGVGCET